jgi:prepilin-type N-terminal cleavage/methylation domain-containing protein
MTHSASKQSGGTRCPQRVGGNAPLLRHPARGFTLVELLVSSTLAALIMASVLSSYIFLGRSLARLANHQALEAKGRAALTQMRGDFTLARAVKSGTTPTSTSLTLTLPSGEVTYTYDSSSGKLSRQATTGVATNLTLLSNAQATCTSFAFDYYTTSGGSPAVSGTNVPYSIKQIQVRFTLATPTGHDANTRVTLGVVSPRFLLRNRLAATGS